MENREKITNYFKSIDKPLKSSEIAEGAGVEKKEVDKILKKLKKEEVIHSPKRCYYELKK